MDKMDIVMDRLGNADPVLGATTTGFDPNRDNAEIMKQDVTLPHELRKFMNRNEPERQNLYQPIFDEASRQEYVDVNELKQKLFEAKWEWYKEETLSQYKVTTESHEKEK